MGRGGRMFGGAHRGGGRQRHLQCHRQAHPLPAVQECQADAADQPLDFRKSYQSPWQRAGEVLMSARLFCAAMMLAIMSVAPAWAENQTDSRQAGDGCADPDRHRRGMENHRRRQSQCRRGGQLPPQGRKAWRKALPLLRIHHEVINSAEPPFRPAEPTPPIPTATRENPWHYDTGNMFAGSILNLQPDTDYECRYQLTDPDGVERRQGKNHHRPHPQGAATGHGRAHIPCLSHRLERARCSSRPLSA